MHHDLVSDDVLASSLAAHGIFAVPGFFGAAACKRVRRSMDAGNAEPAEILAQGVTRREHVRLASNVEVDDEVLSLVERRLDRVRDSVGRFFGLPLGEREGTSFVRYPDGGFYRTHRDRAVDPGWPGAARRRVAVVVFLDSSREVDADGTFNGGTLELYRNEERIAVAPRRGMLVAFPADLLHAVSTVRNGSRDTLVDWFY